MKIGLKYYLGDGENYFIYIVDKYNEETMRAELYDSKNEAIAKTLVKGGMTNVNRSHQDVLNGFEIFVTVNS